MFCIDDLVCICLVERDFCRDRALIVFAVLCYGDCYLCRGAFDICEVGEGVISSLHKLNCAVVYIDWQVVSLGVRGHAARHDIQVLERFLGDLEIFCDLSFVGAVSAHDYFSCSWNNIIRIQYSVVRTLCQRDLFTAVRNGHFYNRGVGCAVINLCFDLSDLSDGLEVFSLVCRILRDIFVCGCV